MCTNSPFFQYMMFLLSAAPSCVLSNIMHMLLMDHWSDLTCLKSLLTKWLKYPTSVLKVIITYAEFTLETIIIQCRIYNYIRRWCIHLRWFICVKQLNYLSQMANSSWTDNLSLYWFGQWLLAGDSRKNFYLPHCHYNILSVALFVLLSSALIFSW